MIIEDNGHEIDVTFFRPDCHLIQICEMLSSSSILVRV